MVFIRRPKRGKCKIYLSDKDFDLIRFSQNPSPEVAVTGRPRYRIGQEGKNFDEFDGHEVKLID